MTISGGFYQSAEGKEAENAIVISALKAFRAHGINTPVLSEAIDIPGLARGQVSGVVTALREQNLLDGSFVKRGYFSLQAYRVSEQGERVLHLAEGIDPLDADKAAIMHILNDAAKKDGPCLLDTAGIQQERAEKLIKNLKEEGMLMRASVQRGFYTLDGVQITEHGKSALAALDHKVKPRPNDITV